MRKGFSLYRKVVSQRLPSIKQKHSAVNGSFTVEAAMIVPMLLVVFAIILTMLFYYHDKNVVGAIAHETVVMGCGEEKIDDADLEQYFQKRIREKLLLFSGVDVETQVREEEIQMTCRARKRGMSLNTRMTMSRTKPATSIRKWQWMDRIGEQIGEIE